MIWGLDHGNTHKASTTQSRSTLSSKPSTTNLFDPLYGIPSPETASSLTDFPLCVPCGISTANLGHNPISNERYGLSFEQPRGYLSPSVSEVQKLSWPTPKDDKYEPSNLGSYCSCGGLTSQKKGFCDTQLTSIPELSAATSRTTQLSYPHISTGPQMTQSRIPAPGHRHEQEQILPTPPGSSSPQWTPTLPTHGFRGSSLRYKHHFSGDPVPSVSIPAFYFDERLGWNQSINLEGCFPECNTKQRVGLGIADASPGLGSSPGLKPTSSLRQPSHSISSRDPSQRYHVDFAFDAKDQTPGSFPHLLTLRTGVPLMQQSHSLPLAHLLQSELNGVGPRRQFQETIRPIQPRGEQGFYRGETASRFSDSTLTERMAKKKWRVRKRH